MYKVDDLYSHCKQFFKILEVAGFEGWGVPGIFCRMVISMHILPRGFYFAIFFLNGEWKVLGFICKDI